jgi:2-dehydro-3-deoxygluconokinase
MTVVTLGESMGLVRARSVGSLEHVSDLELRIGGAESNVAIGLVRLGVPAAWIGRVGDDSVGRRVVRELRAEGLDVHAHVDPGARTGLMLKESPTVDSTRVTYYRSGSAGSRLSPDDLDPQLIRSADLLHVTGITLALSDSAAGAVTAAVEIAQAASIPISFDVNHRASLWGDRDPGEAYRAVARNATVVFAGDDEAALLVGSGSPEDQAARLAELGPTHVIVKLGARGCAASIEGMLLARPAYPVAAIDTVGAGDAFVAGYLAGTLDAAGPEASLDLASRCGALACLTPGDWEGLPRRIDLALLDGRDPVSR